jgi:maltose alpha-D-glucosyltransferase/alpha-amylase
VTEVVGGFPETVRLIARRLAELHIALSADRERPEFAPEEFSPQYQRSLYQSMRKLVADTLYQLTLSRNALPVECQPLCDVLIRQQQALETRFQWLAVKPLESQRIRCHGDCHLAQLLFNGKDFVFIDFEGSPLQSLGERRIKRSPVRDVASMARSFDYAALSALRGLTDGRGRPAGAVRPEDLPLVSRWTDFWSRMIQHTFVATYQEHSRQASFAPPTANEFSRLLDIFRLEQMLNETEYGLTYRPSWLVLPLQRLAEELVTNR